MGSRHARCATLSGCRRWRWAVRRVARRAVKGVGKRQAKKSPPEGELSYWLGYEDSNLGMAESESAALPLGDTPIVGWHLSMRRPAVANRMNLAGVPRIRTWGWRDQNPLPYRLAIPHQGLYPVSIETVKYGWGTRIRTWEWRDQNPLPYRLAIPHPTQAGLKWCGRRDLNSYTLRRQNLNLVRLPISPLPPTCVIKSGGYDGIRTCDPIIMSDVL